MVVSAVSTKFKLRSLTKRKKRSETVRSKTETAPFRLAVRALWTAHLARTQRRGDLRNAQRYCLLFNSDAPGQRIRSSVRAFGHGIRTGKSRRSMMKALFILLALATVCSAQIDVHTIIQRSVEAVRAQLGFCIERRVFRSASGGAPCMCEQRSLSGNLQARTRPIWLRAFAFGNSIVIRA